VDISMQALTKYVGGHSDLLLGTVSVREQRLKDVVGDTYRQLGMAASPDDCSLALRGMQTLGVRLSHIESSALTIARWLAQQPAVDAVFHPALPSCPGHDIWARDFEGSAGVFSFSLNQRVSRERVASFIDSLKLFKIGFSWGGTTSLALAYSDLKRPDVDDLMGRLVRLNIGLEEPDDLIADLRQGLAQIVIA
jgi:cystathionine beta-lyase